MADGSANPSWHPALMPNADGHSPTVEAPGAPQTTLADQPDDTTPSQDASTNPSAQVHHEGNENDTRLSSNGDVADGGAVLDAPVPAGNEPATAEADDSDDAAETHADATSEAAASAPTHAQHSSSLSFARTVSHEVNFHDDDEGDWSLPRRDTDDFKFLGPSDHTNSFPVVPPIASTSAQHSEPLPSNQALDVLEETERDLDADQDQYFGSGATQSSSQVAGENQAGGRGRHAHSRSIGGDVQGFEGVAADTRFEEGVPLISQTMAERESAANVGNHGSAVQTFDDDDEEDDFFAKPQNAQENDNESPSMPSLERKSTMQVLGALTREPLSRQDTLEETPEEDEEESQQKGSDSLGIVGQSENEPDAAKPEQTVEDLEAKWQQAFGDDDDDEEFLDENATDSKDIDAAAFLGSDDEGFLEDTEDTLEAPQSAQSAPQPAATTQAANPYVPNAAGIQRSSSAYAPNQPLTPASPYSVPTPAGQFNAAPYFGQPPQQRPEPTKAQSFADKSKGGYTSPYDLPTDLVNAAKPRKRASAQQLPSPTAAQPPPPRSASMFLPGQTAASTPPGAGQAPGLAAKASTTSLRSANGFFEDLPMTSKPRPSSRTSNRVPSPAHQGPGVQLPFGQSHTAPPPASPMAPPPLLAPTGSFQQPPTQQPPVAGGLVAPERVSPYAPLQSSSNPVPPPSNNTSRYSPAPSAPVSAPPAAAARYSPAPAGSRPTSSYGAAAATTAPPVAGHPHLPRTSSPLAHYEINNEKPHAVIHGTNGAIPLPDRRSSSSYEPRLTRVSSLPPTQEVEEENEAAVADGTLSSQQAPAATESKYSPVIPPATARHTPPLPSVGSNSPLSPPKRAGANYAPYAAQATATVPPRSQTQSPSFTHGNRPVSRSSDFGQRSTSTHSPTSPVLTKAAQTAYSPKQTRGHSLNMNMVPPTDGREHDPLERWKGAPIISWGMGGTVVTTFPKSVPRYGMNQTTPSIFRTPGEVSVKNIKDLAPLPERLAKFPGPLNKKSKKETLAWLAAGIDNLEKELPDISFHSQLSIEAKRAVERLLLWKILRVFIEFDGTLEGSPAVEKAVRDLLSPGTVTPTAENDALFPADGGVSTEAHPVTSMQADGADTNAMEQIRHHLLKGDREAAVWAAADRRLWGHAMLISNTVSPDLYKQVAQEFVRKEVNYPGHSNQSLGALYKVLSGNFDDCVDELVPVHARAGLQLVSTVATSDTTNVTDGLDKWRETLTLILSNRSTDDIHGLHALGNLLSSYGRAEAAHICFLFSRKISVFGGLDDPNASFVLVGSDHRQQTDRFAKDLEAVQLSEVYEYGLSLGGGVAAAAGAPHLATYKLQHAITLAEYGFRDKAMSYCNALATAITSQTKRSPYHHVMLETAVDDFMKRLKQAPKEESSTWTKPSIDKVSGRMWSKFTNFVAGDDDEGNGKAAGADVTNGPFGHIGTPMMSRSPSVTNLEGYATGSPMYQPNVGAATPSFVASKYAPMAGQALGSSPNPYDPMMHHAAPASARTSMDRGSNEFTRNPYEPAYPAAPAVPNLQPSMYEPHAPASGLQEAASIYPAYGTQEAPADTSNQSYQPPSYGYEPPSLQAAAEPEDSKSPTQNDVNGGYEAPSMQSFGYEPPSSQSYGYEPPSYEPDPEPSNDDDETVKKPKKSFMDDDEDDIPALRPSQEKSKADKDRENEEMFRKAAEEDAKRAAAQQSAKKGWGFGGWFGGSKKGEAGTPGEPAPAKAIKAKLGEESSFVYDPDLKRWVNKKPGAENTEAKKATPPPPKGAPVSSRGTPPPPSATPPPMAGRASAPPPSGGSPSRPMPIPALGKPPSTESLGLSTSMARTASNNSIGGPPSAPPSRPATSMSNASSIDDLLSASGPRKPGQKKPRKSGRYVDVMAK